MNESKGRKTATSYFSNNTDTDPSFEMLGRRDYDSRSRADRQKKMHQVQWNYKRAANCGKGRVREEKKILSRTKRNSSLPIAMPAVGTTNLMSGKKGFGRAANTTEANFVAGAVPTSQKVGKPHLRGLYVSDQPSGYRDDERGRGEKGSQAKLVQGTGERKLWKKGGG